MKLIIDIDDKIYENILNETPCLDVNIAEVIKNSKVFTTSYWIRDWYNDLFCENCGCHLQDEQTYIPLNFCPKCGAEMIKIVEVESDKENSYELSKVLSFRYSH